MPTGQSGWGWDPHRQDHYYATRDSNGRLTYHYLKNSGKDSSGKATHEAQHVDLKASLEDSSGKATHEAHHADLGSRERTEMIRGNPEDGLYERLDSSYCTRVGAEIHSFFTIGRVFAMLHIQAASASELAPLSDNITIVQYGERAFSQIRRFVIVEVKRGFVYACPITTYSGRGCLKRGCIPSEHSVIHMAGTSASYFDGEYEAGLTKSSIKVIPANPSITLTPSSRLHYAKVYPIEMNIRVKEVGMVCPEDLNILIAYYNQENNMAPPPVSAANSLSGIGSYVSFPISSDPPATPTQPARISTNSFSEDKTYNPSPPSQSETDIAPDKDREMMTGLETANRPKAFFKRGRVFKTLRSNGIQNDLVAGASCSDTMQMCTFAVIRPQDGQCICLSIQSYDGQGTLKPGVVPEDHAAVMSVGYTQPDFPLEPRLRKPPILVKIENQSEGPLDPMSRINFATQFTIWHDVKIRKVGRVLPESIHQIDLILGEYISS